MKMLATLQDLAVKFIDSSLGVNSLPIHVAYHFTLTGQVDLLPSYVQLVVISIFKGCCTHCLYGMSCLLTALLANI